MQGALLDDHGRSLKFRRLPVQRPVPGQMLTRMAASLMNPSDPAFLRDGYAGKPLPALPAVGGSEKLIAVGSDPLPRFSMGKRFSCASAPGKDLKDVPLV